MFLLPVEGDNPTRHRAYAVFALLVATAVLAMWPLVGGVERTFRVYGYVPNNHEPFALVTSMFLHGSIWHLLGNLFFLFMFGDNIEDVVGPIIFLIAYFVSGIVATLTYAALTSHPDIPLIGASGAISGIVGMYLVFFPQAPFELHLVVLQRSVQRWRVSAFFATGVWFGTQLLLGIVLSLLRLDAYIGIAFWAHVGGFVVGVLIGRILVALGYVRRYSAMRRRSWLLGYVAQPAHPAHTRFALRFALRSRVPLRLALDRLAHRKRIGYFLAVTGFRTESFAEVTASITDYMTSHTVQVESIPVESQPNPRRDAQVYAPVDGWTVVLWPEYFNIHDFPLARAVAATRNWLVSTIHVYDDEYWEHLCCSGPTELHAFCSRPHFWRDESSDDYYRVIAYATEPSRLASVLSMPAQVIQPYLVDVDTLADPQARAYADDDFPLGDFWVFTDFWRRLGIRYPTPAQNLSGVLRLAANFDKKLPAA